MRILSLIRNSHVVYVIFAFLLSVASSLPGINIPNVDMSNVILPNDFEERLLDDAFENTADVRIMSSNVLVDYDWGSESHPGENPVPPRAAMFFEMIEAYLPDVVGVQEQSKAWSAAFIQYLPDRYKLINPVSTYLDQKMTTLVYNSDTLDLVDSGDFKFSFEGADRRLRRVAWGIFKVKATGKYFGVTSTHFDGNIANSDIQVNEMLAIVNKICEKYDCPVFSVGDYNTRDNIYEHSSWSETYAKITGSLIDSKYHCETAVAGDAKDHLDEVKNNIYVRLDMPFIDHIFIKGNAEAKTYCVLSYTYLDDMSDAFPIFADMILK